MTLAPSPSAARLLDLLPERPEVELVEARLAVAARVIRYPLGSGQADEIALAAGLKPVIRQLLDPASLVRARARFEAAGFSTFTAATDVGATRAGVLERNDVAAGAHRRALFVARDAALLADARYEDFTEQRRLDTGELVVETIGRLLGYPRCCVRAFAAAPEPRRNMDVMRAALGATAKTPYFRLNGLDLRVFHYVSWWPCSFDCELSIRYSDALAARVARRHGDFARRIDEVLAAHRLVLHDDVQLSFEGARDGEGYRIEKVWPSARDRHAGSVVDRGTGELCARAFALVRRARRLAVTGEGVWLDDALVPGTAGAFCVPFGLGREPR